MPGTHHSLVDEVSDERHGGDAGALVVPLEASPELEDDSLHQQFTDVWKLETK